MVLVQQEDEIRVGAGKKGMRLGKYEVGKTLGEGNFGKVKYARHVETGQSFAIKILEKSRILDLKSTDQVFFFFLKKISVSVVFMDEFFFFNLGFLGSSEMERVYQK